jgi:hypothetical protein
MPGKPSCECANDNDSYDRSADLPVLRRMLTGEGWCHVSRGSGDGVALQPLEISFQFGARLAPNLAIFFESFIDDLIEPRRNSRIQANWGDRRTIENRFEDHSGSIALERQRAGAHFIKHRAERKQIRTDIQFFPAHLFRTHVRDRSNGGARTGQIFFQS